MRLSITLLISLWGNSLLLGWAFVPHSHPKQQQQSAFAISNENALRPRDSQSRLWATDKSKAKDDSSDSDSSSDEKPKPKRKKQSRKKKSSKQQTQQSSSQQQQQQQLTSKEDLVKAVGEKMRTQKQQQAAAASPSAAASTDETDDTASLLDYLNPFKAGQKLRRSIDTAVTSLSTEKEQQRSSIYYLDDRFLDASPKASSSSADTASSSLDQRLEQEDFVPEVLVIGATGEVGRLVVRQLLLRGLKVRVLVRDLYTKTLNLLGTGVTYCQGDLNNSDSLEYAVTDVDKICFCASAPRPDEEDFQSKFQDFMKENLETRESAVERLKQELKDSNSKQQSSANADTTASSSDATASSSDPDATAWDQLGAVLSVRSNLAEQVDLVGMQNVVRAYQHVRHADYGTSQAAKRSLFKFVSRPADFNLFSILQNDDDADDANGKVDLLDYNAYDDDEYDEADDSVYDDEDYDDEYEDDDYDEYAEDEQSSSNRIARRRDESVQAGCQWVRNQFQHGVFVGRVPKVSSRGVGGEAAICSTRFRGRDDPENGIDLSTGFAGFICRVCSDGGRYEAFVRTAAYYEQGIEYVCEFSTVTKPTGRNKSKNKFTTVRLPFASFKPVQSGSSASDPEFESTLPEFDGADVRNIGFRYRSASNALKSQLEPGELSSFYLALSYMKLYRSQPEPEFVYLSDARIPPMVRNGMVSHQARQLVLEDQDGSGTAGGAVKLLDDDMMSVSRQSPEETYFKYRGEEILKSSGLSYAIIRVAGYNESPTAEAATIDLVSSPDQDGALTAVSRAEVAQVCARALMDPAALNKSFYVSKRKGNDAVSSSGDDDDADMQAKFAALQADAVV